MTAPEHENPFGWTLPVTDLMLYDESPYVPLVDPAQNIAERLVMLAHLCFSNKVWGVHTGRMGRYWDALGEHIEGCANSNPDLASWWGHLMRDLPGEALKHKPLLHEKNLLCRPMSLPGTQVADQDVLMALRTYNYDLRDRARMWAQMRREMRSKARAAIEAEGEVDTGLGEDEETD